VTVHTDQGARPGFPIRVDEATCDLDDLKAVLSEAPGDDDLLGLCPHAERIEHGAVVYRADRLRAALSADAASPRAVAAELDFVLDGGPGIFVVTGAVDRGIVARATTAFEALISAEREATDTHGDHFAEAGANDRVWNALEKLASADAEVFVDYYSNDMIALGAMAWLGPGYQITSQVNVVRPGGKAQSPHRDYHLGFMTNERAQHYPPAVHRLSPRLTLQGAVAHCDMPIETGPTMYLPHSQKYPLGYLAWRRPDFVDFFDAHRVQVPLEAGDLVYFNPALFHGAGTNRTSDVRRMANLLQISSPFGRAMESVDRTAMTKAVFPALLAAKRRGMSRPELANALAACAEAYAFPTNLDRDPPVGGLTPPSQYDVTAAALDAELEAPQVTEQLDLQARRRLTR
jgi:ectoine hydroxylase-related dioxygenase (phytanoyl-CoA dioxygenase family)